MEKKMKEEKNETRRVGGEPPLAEYSASLEASNKNSETQRVESKSAETAPPEASEAKAENKPVEALHWDTKRDLSTLILDMTFNLAVELEQANKKIEELETKMARSSGGK
jgi:flagellar motor switch/type III secretory pathway protein FliN